MLAKKTPGVLTGAKVDGEEMIKTPSEGVWYLMLHFTTFVVIYNLYLNCNAANPVSFTPFNVILGISVKDAPSLP